MAHTSGVASPKRPDIQEKDLQGFKLFKLLMPVLAKLHHHGCQRDRAGNRKLHYDQYAALILLYFFNPIVTSLRGIVQASGLKKVQRMLKCSRAALVLCQRCFDGFTRVAQRPSAVSGHPPSRGRLGHK